MKFFKLTKKGTFFDSRNGDWVKRKDYDDLVKENRFLKKELTLENLNLKLTYFIEELNLNSEGKLTANILGSTLITVLNMIVKDYKNRS